MRSDSKMRLCSKSATHQNFEAPYFLAIDKFYSWNNTKVMHEYQCRIFFTAAECYFKFTSHFLANGFAKKIFKHCMGIRSNVKWLIRINACNIRCCYISNRITACFTDGNICLLYTSDAADER